MRPLGDGFIRLIRMIMPRHLWDRRRGHPKMGDMKNVGRIGLRSVIYFEVVSTLALVIGLIVINVYEPGFASTPTRDAD